MDVNPTNVSPVTTPTPSEETITFFVHGLPQSQGSVKAFVVNGKPILTSTNKNVDGWRKLIAMSAQPYARTMEGGVMVTATFYLPRPKSLPKKVSHHTKRPDVDKLLRALLDSFTGIFYKDDSQVCHVNVRKAYADAETSTGVEVRIGPVPV